MKLTSEKILNILFSENDKYKEKIIRVLFGVKRDKSDFHFQLEELTKIHTENINKIITANLIIQQFPNLQISDYYDFWTPEVNEMALGFTIHQDWEFQGEKNIPIIANIFMTFNSYEIHAAHNDLTLGYNFRIAIKKHLTMNQGIVIVDGWENEMKKEKISNIVILQIQERLNSWKRRSHEKINNQNTW